MEKACNSKNVKKYFLILYIFSRIKVTDKTFYMVNVSSE